jgi:RNA polymerase sigma-70 factor, ECF subfamily
MRGLVRSLDSAAAVEETAEPLKPAVLATDSEKEAPPPGEAPSEKALLDHVAALRRYALLLVGEAADADDLVQECVLRVLSQARTWRPVRDLRAYMFAVLHNAFIDTHRRRRSRQTEVPIETVIADLSAPASQTKWLEVRDLVAALAQLPTEQREVVLLVGLEGMSYLEAASVLDIPIGTVMSRLSRGREALRQLTTHGVAGRLRIVK